MNDLHGHLGRLHDKKRPVIRLIILATGLACLFLAGFCTWFILAARQTQIYESEVATSNVARMVAIQVESAMKATSMALENVAERVETDGTGDAALTRLHVHLVSLAKTVPELHGLFVYGADGKWLSTSLDQPMKGNNSDREYFRHHRANPSRAIHIGRPIKSRSTGAWIIPVSQRIDGPDGKFAGVALVTLRINFFERTYEELNIGKSGAVLLALSDGTAVYRRPFDEKLIGMDLSGGAIFRALRSRGPGSSFLLAKVDNIERLYSYRDVNGFPFYVAVGLAKDEMLANWQKSSLLIGLTGLLINALLMIFAKKLITQIRIRDRLDARLHEYSEQLREHNAGLHLLANTDKLTGLANRRLFDDRLEQEFRRARRAGTPLSLMMIDLDYFKQFNDHYGHPAGDACLRSAAGVLSSLIVRAGDLAARYGGEEFVVLLPSTSGTGAVAVAERIRASLQALQLPHAHSPLGVLTASLGVAAIDGHSFATAGELIEEADRNLYIAKRDGKNAVCGGRIE
jgi:diguanylate cyclase (GGDEF)-like protein